jgi:hypothetical protein
MTSEKPAISIKLLTKRLTSLLLFTLILGVLPQQPLQASGVQPVELIEMALLPQPSPENPVIVSGSAGADGEYATLAGAFSSINAFDQTGSIISVILTGNTTESSAGAILYQGNWVSLTVYPTTEVSVSGDVPSALVSLNGADRVVIDGRINQNGSSGLTLTNLNTGTSASTILFSNSAENNLIRFCTITGGSANTTGGIISFSNSAVAPGNHYNSVLYNTLSGLNGTDRPANAVYSAATAPNLNAFNTVTSNHIFNFLNPSIASNGILLSAGSADWTISGNSFYETSPFSPVSDVEYTAIRVDASSGNGFVISGNFIGGNAPEASGTWTKSGSANNPFYGISMSTGTSANSNSVQGNTLRGFDWTNSLNGNFTAILVSTGLVNIGNLTGNTIGSSTGTGSIALTLGTSSPGADPGGFFGIRHSSTTASAISNNTIGGITTANQNPLHACSIFGIAKTSGFTASPLVISNNLIGSLTEQQSIQATSASTDSIQVVNGIYYQIRNVYLGFATITGNTISGLANLSTHASSTDFVAGAQVHGIHTYLFSNTITGNTISYLSNTGLNTNNGIYTSVAGIMARFSTTNQQISGNTIHHLSNTSTARAKVSGIYYHGSQNLNNKISENFIHDLSVATITSGAPFGEIYGVRANFGSATYSNNIISLGEGVSSSLYVYGIYEPGTSNNNVNLYYNTIRIAGVSNQSGCNSYAYFSSNNLNLKNIQNNIFHNERTSTAGGTYHCAVHFQLNNNGVQTCDYNNYFIGTEGYTARLGPPTPLVVVQSLADWRTTFGFDAHSSDENSEFSNPGGQFASAADFVPSSPETGNGVAAVPTDFNGILRGCTNSLGAFEYQPAAGTPDAITIFSGSEPTCQTLGTEITQYTSAATNSTGLNWSLSNAAAGTLNPTTGEMSWNAGFSGSVDIQVTATGCNGTSDMTTRTVNITPAAGPPDAISIFSGSEPTCQTLGTEITQYTSAATNSTGLNWSLSNAAAGTLNAVTGEMSWNAGFSGSVDIQVTATGCNGTSDMTTRTVSITPAAGTPDAITIFSGSEPTCQTLGTEITQYTSAATNSTGLNWSLSNAAAGTLNPTTGEMSWNAGFSGSVDIQVTATGCNGASDMTTRTVSITPAAGTPDAITIFSGSEPTCQTLGTEITQYTSAATNSTGLNWSLSNAAAGTLNAETGEMSWNAGFSGSVDIQVTATGCNGTSDMTTRTVNITPAAGTPDVITIFSGSEPTCQTLGTEITQYTSAANNSTGLNWSLSNAAAGSINPTTGEMAWNAGFSGNVDIQITASGCNGTSEMTTRTVSIVPAAGTPDAITIFSGSEPSCQTLGTEITQYTTAANNSTGLNWSLSNAAAGSINATTGEMSWNAGFSGNVDIQVTATGCNGTSEMTSRTVSITPAAGTPDAITIFSGSEPSCQTLGTEITQYTSAATNSTGLNWSLSNAAAGILNATTGEMSWNAGFSGNVDIQVTATGCNGSSDMTIRTVTVNPVVTPSVSISTPFNPVTEGAPATIAASPVNGGNNPAYQWKVNGTEVGTNNPEYTYIPQNGDEVQCFMVSDAACVTGNPAVSEVLVMETATARSLNIHVFLQGLYIGNGQMKQAYDESGPHFPDGVADQVSLSLRDAADGSVVAELNNINLSTDGNLSVQVPAEYDGIYYIYLTHRNSIATATVAPISLAGSSTSLDLSNPSAVYGNNLLQMIDGVFVIYTGDVNQDGVVDTGDMTPVDNDAATYAAGYLVTDCNGDGVADTGDTTLVDNNAANYAGAALPF